MFSDNPNLKRLQEAELETLIFFDNLCNKYKLRYYLCGGSLIGAIREKGFIPWDDDVDIMMPRSDYEWLIEHRDEVIPEQYYLNDYSLDDKQIIPRPIPALYNKKVELLEKDCKKSVRQFAFIDIFVLDGMPQRKIRRELHYYHVFFWHTLLQLSWFDEYVSQHREDRSLFGKLAIKILNNGNIFSILDSKSLYKKKNNLLKKYGWEESDYVCSLFGPKRKKEILPKDIFASVERVCFEDIFLSVPIKYDEELKHYYGDYMTPPTDPNEREFHHYIEVIEKK